MTTHAARLAAAFALSVMLTACERLVLPTGSSPSGPPPSSLDSSFFRMCPFCTTTGPATVMNGTLSVSEPGEVPALSRDVEVGTIRLTIQLLAGPSGGPVTHRVDILAIIAERTIEVPATARITSASAGGPFTELSATSRNPEARKCAAPVEPGATSPPPINWPDQTTTLSLLPEGTGYTGVMTYDSCPDNPAVLKQERFRVRIP